MKLFIFIFTLSYFSSAAASTEASISAKTCSAEKAIEVAKVEANKMAKDLGAVSYKVALGTIGDQVKRVPFSFQIPNNSELHGIVFVNGVTCEASGTYAVVSKEFKVQ